MFALHQSKNDLSIVIKQYDCNDSNLHGRFGVCDEFGNTDELPYKEGYGQIVDPSILDSFKGDTCKKTTVTNGVEKTEIFGKLTNNKA